MRIMSALQYNDLTSITGNRNSVYLSVYLAGAIRPYPSGRKPENQEETHDFRQKVDYFHMRTAGKLPELPTAMEPKTFEP